MIVLQVRAAAQHTLPEVLAIAKRHPGDERLAIETESRRLMLGPAMAVDGSDELIAELSEHGGVERC